MPFRSPVVRAVTALSFTQLIGWGATFYLPAVTGPAMARDLDLPLSMIMAGPTIMLVVMAVMSWPLSGIFERHGARPVMGFGSPLGAVGLIIMASAQGLVSYVLAWVMLGLAGACMLTTPAQIAVTEIAGQKARQALGMLILAGGLTSTIVWPLTGLLQASWGWRQTTLAYGLLMLVVCTSLHWATLARHTQRVAKEIAIDPNVAEPPPIDRTRFALLAMSFASNGFVTWGFALTIIILFQRAGLDEKSALTAAAFIGIAQWAGRLIDFAGGRHVSGFVIGLAAAAMVPLSFLILLFASNFTGAMLFAALYGMASGITGVTRATLPLQIFPSGSYGRASAQLAVPLNLSFAAAPPAFAALMTAAGPQTALWLAFAISIFAFSTLLCLWFVHRRMQSSA